MISWKQAYQEAMEGWQSAIKDLDEASAICGKAEAERDAARARVKELEAQFERLRDSFQVD